MIFRVGEDVGDVLDLVRQNHAPRRSSCVRGRRSHAQIAASSWARRATCAGAIREDVALAQRRSCRDCAPHELHGDSTSVVEHRVEIERRAADDLQHIGGRRLLRERFLEVARLGLHLLEQPHVLDGDDGLIGEGLDELDLARREGAGLGPRQRENADRLSSRISGTPSMARTSPSARRVFSA